MKAFLKKEWMEMTRTGRMWILVLIFVLFGIMNPAMAKLTPWMMEMMSDSLADAGFLLAEIQVDVFDSWIQFYKNIPMGLIIFVLMCSGIFTSEYQKGTLIPVVTKGLPRRKILAAKTVTLLGTWTVLYFLCYGITYGYNEWFWDNSTAAYPWFGAVCFWLFGIWVIALMVFFSVVAESNTQVILGTGAISLGVYLLGMFRKLKGILPAKLMEGMAILQGAAEPEEYYIAMAAAGVTAIGLLGFSAVCFDRKRL